MDSDRATEGGAERPQLDPIHPRLDDLFAPPAHTWGDYVRAFLGIVFGFVLLPWLSYRLWGVARPFLGLGP